MKRITVIIIALATAGILQAATYYVSPTGNDSLSGTLPVTAWKTIARVNIAKLVAGDSVLFKRGEIFRGNLLPVSGSSSGYITYGAYGTGDKPKLFGSYQRNSISDWKNEGGNIWVTSQYSVNTIGLELISNLSFDNDISGWFKWDNTGNGASTVFSRTTAAGEYYFSPGGGKLVCNNHGNALSDIQLWTICSIKSLKWYKILFKAKATQQFTFASGGIQLMKTSSPWTVYCSSSSSQSVTITTSWSTYAIYYQSNSTANDVRINFSLGNTVPNGATFYFDSLSFKECDKEPELFNADVGNIIFNDESFCGVKVSSEVKLNLQGKFWYDNNNNLLKIYSVSNPATYYSNIELARTINIINESNKSYVTYENLDLRYSSACGIDGINTNHIWVKDLDISYIGGGYMLYKGNPNVRFGNGIQFWNAAHDNIVERCVFNQIYDAAMTAQGKDSLGFDVYNIFFRNNVVNNSEYSFEYWENEGNTIAHDIYFENNTCLNTGNGWGHSQRPDPNGTHLMFYKNSAQTNNVYIRNNIFYNSTNWGVRWLYASDVNKVILDYNCWYESSGLIARIENTFYDFATQWAVYQTASGQDANSINKAPLLNSDYALTNNSPCIDAGFTLINVTDDYNRVTRPQGTGYDIGAYEFSLPTDAVAVINIPTAIVYPNPSSGKFTINMKIKVGIVNGKIAIYNVLGERVYLSPKLPISKSSNHEIDLSALPTGIYFLQVNTGEQIINRKLVLEK